VVVKTLGTCLLVGCVTLVALDMAGIGVAITIHIGIVADIEGLAISVILPELKTHVPTLVHALRSRGTST
jgi:hypothetical protein